MLLFRAPVTTYTKRLRPTCETSVLGKEKDSLAAVPGKYYYLNVVPNSATAIVFDVK